MTEQYREREDKYEVGPDWTLPDLSAVLPSGAKIDQRTLSLSSKYFDTPAGALRANGVTLRLRTGDTDTGWQLKVPEDGARTELRVPAEGNGNAVPAELRDLLIGLRRGAPLKAVATLATTRTISRIVDATGELLAEIDDDHVRATINGGGAAKGAGAAAGGGDAPIEWREVEVELGCADESFLAAVGKKLTKSGAAPARSRSKLARVLGEPGSAANGPKARVRTLSDLVAAYLGQQYDALIAADVALRRGQDVVHQTRVATRRYRSILRVFADMFDPDQASALDADLAWYAGVLGAVRDREVLRAHLLGAVAQLPPEIVLGPVAGNIDTHLHSEQLKARQALQRQMRGRRYLALLTTLHDWHTDPPLTEQASAPVETVRGYLDQAGKALRRRLTQSSRADAPDELLHRTRKAGKRTRYTAELAVPVLGRSARRVERRAKKLQDVLGAYQDSIVASEVLRQLGTSAGVRVGENGFTYGILYDREQQRLLDARDRARKIRWS